MSSIRQAALCIHGLNSRDQKWVLSKLPKQQRLTIKGMLRELSAIGIPADQDWLPQVQEKIDTAIFDKSFDPVTLEQIELIDHASVADIKKLLLVETDDFIASLLSIRCWEWQDLLLDVFSKQRKSRIEYLLEGYKQNQVRKEVVIVMLSIIAAAIKKAADY